VRVAALLLLGLLPPAFAQEAPAFDESAADAELAEFADYLDSENVDSEALATARSRVARIESASTACAADSLASRTRLEERFEPLRELNPDEASAETLSQRQEVRALLDEAIARQAACEGLIDESRALLAQIDERQNRLSQQFLSSRAGSFLTLLREFPQRAATWPSRLREAVSIELAGGLTRALWIWLLIGAAAVAGAAGLVARRRFAAWYAAGGGDDAPPQMKYLLPKPAAEFAPLLLPAAALLAVLMYSIEDVSSGMVVVRIGWALLASGVGLVIINWVTGPLSPSRDIKGLIPDHVAPLRLRMRLVLLAICTSYVVLGNEWLAIRISQPHVAGRASMIFVVGASVLLLIAYLGRIPGLANRYRLLRFAAAGTAVIGLLALLSGYQNLAEYLVQGVTRTTLALFLLWVLLWAVYYVFNYLIEQDTPAASSVRATLGISDKGSGTGIGFMQLIADLILWISVVVYLIYVWDNTGTTLGRLRDVVVQGWTIGGVSLVPRNIVGGILIFTALIVVVGWMKRWIDRRWLQRIVIERGARDAILTLFGYLGFIGAIIISLVLANVDLTGLAIISGALALGLGFGMQEIASNFVSGLILLFERPIRAGDFVTVGDVEGYVRSIRIRATEIETLDNQNVLVPNSELVSGRVTNWVLRDTQGRLIVRVGVAYGSDVELVREILERIGNAHPEVITDGRAPAPKVFFMGFGDSTLDFELRLRVQRIERRFSVMSDINFAIEREFRGADIKIPFPQRDLHIVTNGNGPPVPSSAPSPAGSARSSPRSDVTRSHQAELDTAAGIEEVWVALTEPETLRRWLTTDGTLEPKVGGAIDFALRDGYRVTGQFDVVARPHRLRAVLTPLDGEDPLSGGPIRIDIALTETDTGTHLAVAVAGIPADEDWEGYYQVSVNRWRDALALLKTDVLGR